MYSTSMTWCSSPTMINDTTAGGFDSEAAVQKPDVAVSALSDTAATRGTADKEIRLSETIARKSSLQDTPGDVPIADVDRSEPSHPTQQGMERSPSVPRYLRPTYDPGVNTIPGCSTLQELLENSQSNLPVLPVYCVHMATTQLSLCLPERLLALVEDASAKSATHASARIQEK